MKFGCFGCLALIVVGLVLMALVAGGLFLSINIFGTPNVRPINFSKVDGYSAQQKLFEVVLRQSGRSSRKEPISLSEREANAFLSRHLAESAGVPLSPLVVRFEDGQLFAQGQTPLRNLFQGPPFAQLLPYVPDKRLDQQVWVTLRAQVHVDSSLAGGSRYGTVTITQLELGRQPVSSFLLYIMMGPSGAGLFRWPVPPNVEDIQIQEGQAIIRTR